MLYIRDFYGVLSALFHYTYRWNQDDEQQRTTVALMEHLDYLAALKSRDWTATEHSLRRHLATARLTMLRAIEYGPYG